MDSAEYYYLLDAVIPNQDDRQDGKRQCYSVVVKRGSQLCRYFITPLAGLCPRRLTTGTLLSVGEKARLI